LVVVAVGRCHDTLAIWRDLQSRKPPERRPFRIRESGMPRLVLKLTPW
jgi:hypothetical protein